MSANAGAGRGVRVAMNWQKQSLVGQLRSRRGVLQPQGKQAGRAVHERTGNTEGIRQGLTGKQVVRENLGYPERMEAESWLAVAYSGALNVAPRRRRWVPMHSRHVTAGRALLPATHLPQALGRGTAHPLGWALQSLLPLVFPGCPSLGSTKARAQAWRGAQSTCRRRYCHCCCYCCCCPCCCCRCCCLPQAAGSPSLYLPDLCCPASKCGMPPALRLLGGHRPAAHSRPLQVPS